MDGHHIELSPPASPDPEPAVELQNERRAIQPRRRPIRPHPFRRIYENLPLVQGAVGQEPRVPRPGSLEEKCHNFCYDVARTSRFAEDQSLGNFKANLDRQLSNYCKYEKDKGRFSMMQGMSEHDRIMVRNYYDDAEHLSEINQRLGPFLFRKNQNIPYEFEEYAPVPNHFPVSLAAEVGCFPIFRLLMEKGSTANITVSNDVTPLHIACGSGFYDIAAYMLTHCGVCPEVTTPYGNLTTPLMTAVIAKEQVCVVLLFERGATPDKIDRSGKTALFYAVQGGDINILRCLRDYQASVIIRDNKGRTPLHCMYSKHVTLNSERRMAMLRYLIDQDARLVGLLQGDGASSLCKAVKYGDLPEVQYLVEHGAEVNVGMKNGWKSALWYAIMSPERDIQVIEYLLEQGAQVDLVNSDAITMLEYCTDIPEADDVVALLVAAGNRPRAQPEAPAPNEPFNIRVVQHGPIPEPPPPRAGVDQIRIRPEFRVNNGNHVSNGWANAADNYALNRVRRRFNPMHHNVPIRGHPYRPPSNQNRNQGQPAPQVAPQPQQGQNILCNSTYQDWIAKVVRDFHRFHSPLLAIPGEGGNPTRFVPLSQLVGTNDFQVYPAQRPGPVHMPDREGRVGAGGAIRMPPRPNREGGGAANNNNVNNAGENMANDNGAGRDGDDPDEDLETEDEEDEVGAGEMDRPDRDA